MCVQAVLQTVSGRQQLCTVFDEIGKKTNDEAAGSPLAPLVEASLPVDSRGPAGCSAGVVSR